MLRARLIAGFCAALVYSQSANADLRTDLAKQFNTDPAYLVVNLPPRPSGWPGSIYTNDMRLTLVAGKPNDASIGRGPEYSFTKAVAVDLSAESGVNLAGLFGVSAEGAKSVSADFSILRARTYELTVSQMQSRLSKLPSQHRRAPWPVIVYRAYEGVVELTVRRDASMDAGAWSKLKTRLLSGRVTVAANQTDLLKLASPEPIIFAFEVVRANDLFQAFAPGTFTGCYGSCVGADIRNVGVGTTASGKAVNAGFGGASNVGAIFDLDVADAAKLFGLERVPASEFEAANPKP